MTEPTDAEIDVMVAAYLGDCGPQATRVYSFARAVLAKWGTPQPTQAQAGAVPLTAYQIHEAIKAFKDSENLMGVNHIHVARAIERAHGIGIKGGQHEI